MLVEDIRQHALWRKKSFLDKKATCEGGFCDNAVWESPRRERRGLIEHELFLGRRLEELPNRPLL